MKKEVDVVFIDDKLEKEFLDLPEDNLLKKKIKHVIINLKKTLLLENQSQRD